MRSKLLAIAVLTLTSSSAFAATPCLRQNQIDDWKALNDRTVIVQNVSHVKFKLTLIGVCHNLQYHETMGFKTFDNTRLSCLSRGDDIVVSGMGMGEEQCPITKIELYTPEMQRADEAEAKAKLEAH